MFKRIFKKLSLIILFSTINIFAAANEWQTAGIITKINFEKQKDFSKPLLSASIGGELETVARVLDDVHYLLDETHMQSHNFSQLNMFMNRLLCKYLDPSSNTVVKQFNEIVSEDIVDLLTISLAPTSETEALNFCISALVHMCSNSEKKSPNKIDLIKQNSTYDFLTKERWLIFVNRFQPLADAVNQQNIYNFAMGIVLGDCLDSLLKTGGYDWCLKTGFLPETVRKNQALRQNIWELMLSYGLIQSPIENVFSTENPYKPEGQIKNISFTPKVVVLGGNRLDPKMKDLSNLHYEMPEKTSILPMAVGSIQSPQAGDDLLVISIDYRDRPHILANVKDNVFLKTLADFLKTKLKSATALEIRFDSTLQPQANELSSMLGRGIKTTIVSIS